MLLRGSEALMLFLVEFLVHKLHGLPLTLAYLSTLFPFPPLSPLFFFSSSLFLLSLSLSSSLSFHFLSFSGVVAERVDLRYFLTIGMIGIQNAPSPLPPLSLSFLLLSYLNHVGSAVSTGMLGVAYFANIHHLYYFIIWMALSGMMQVENKLF